MNVHSLSVFYILNLSPSCLPASLSEYSGVTNSLLILIYFCAFITSVIQDTHMWDMPSTIFYCKVCSQIIIYVPKKYRYNEAEPPNCTKI